MSSPPNPSFRETPSKTTIFVVEFREKTGVPRSAEPFPGEREQGFAISFPTRKRQRISNENLAQLLEILLFSLFATRRGLTGNISASQTLNLIPRNNLTLSNFLRIFVFCNGDFRLQISRSHRFAPRPQTARVGRTPTLLRRIAPLHHRGVFGPSGASGVEPRRSRTGCGVALCLRCAR